MRRRHTIRGLTTLWVDEISYCKGRKFATLVYDLDRARVLWVGQGKGRDTIDRFFNDWLSRGQKARVAWASCDMSPAYIGAISAAVKWMWRSDRRGLRLKVSMAQQVGSRRAAWEGLGL